MQQSFFMRSPVILIPIFLFFSIMIWDIQNRLQNAGVPGMPRNRLKNSKTPGMLVAQYRDIQNKTSSAKFVLITATKYFDLLPLVYVSVLRVRQYFPGLEWIIVKSNYIENTSIFNETGDFNWIHELEYRGVEKSEAGHIEKNIALNYIRNNPSIINGSGWLYLLDGDNAAPEFTGFDSIRQMDTNITYWANQELCSRKVKRYTKRPDDYLDIMRSNSSVSKRTFRKILLHKIDTGAFIMSLNAWRAVDALSPLDFEAVYEHDGLYFTEFVYRLWQLKFNVRKLKDGTVKLFYNAFRCHP